MTDENPYKSPESVDPDEGPQEETEEWAWFTRLFLLGVMSIPVAVMGRLLLVVGVVTVVIGIISLSFMTIFSGLVAGAIGLLILKICRDAIR